MKTLKIDRILIIVFLWTYGVWKTPTLGNLQNDMGIVFLLVIFYFALLKFLPEIDYDLVKIKQAVYRYAPSCLLALIISLPLLLLDLDGDSLAHSQEVFIPLIKNFPFLIHEVPMIANISSKFVFQIYNWILGIGLIAFYHLLKHRSNWTWAVGFACLFLLLRVIPPFQSPVHPPARTISLMLSSGLFGIFDRSFKLPQILISLAALVVGIEAVIPKAKNWEKNLSLLVLFFVPYFFYSATIVEQAPYSFFVITFFLSLILANKRDEGPSSTLIYFSIFSLFLMIRLSAILSFIPLVFFLLLNSSWRRWPRSHWRIVVLILLVPVPLLLKSLFFGTPATLTSEETHQFYFGLSFFDKWLTIIGKSGWLDILNNNHLNILLGLTIPTVLIWGRTRWNVLVCALVIFVSGFFIFFSLSPRVWGIPKYQLEYVYPLIFVCIILWIQKFHEFVINTYFRIVLFSVSILVGLFYCFEYRNDFIGPAHPNYLHMTAPYSKFYTHLAENNWPNFFISGATYGVFSSVLNGVPGKVLNQQIMNEKILGNCWLSKWENLEQVNLGMLAISFECNTLLLSKYLKPSILLHGTSMKFSTLEHPFIKYYVLH